LKRIELTGSDGDWQRKRTLEEIERYTWLDSKQKVPKGWEFNM
jgi:hypothetical protein